MNKRRALVEDADGVPMEGHEVLMWGNNAAWHCVACDALLGDRTGNGDREVTCEACAAEYQILRQGGSLTRAEGVRRRS